MNRIAALQKHLDNNTAFLIENAVNLRYFTGSDIDTGILLLLGGEVCFFTDSRYIESAQKQISAPIKVELLKKKSEQLKEVLQGVEKLYLETSYQTLQSAAAYKKIAPLAEDDLLDKLITGSRECKTDEEIDCIKRAQSLTDGAFSHILSYIKEGVSERDIALEIEWFMRRGGASGVSFDLIAISGENTSLPHGIPSDRTVKQGDFITMDIGCKVGGYCSDMTRTVALGFVTDEMKLVYDTVLSAQKAALKAVRAGVAANEVDNAARSVIESAGYGDYFGHSTGHGVGLDIHESPVCSPSCKQVLIDGMVVTVEPGIYLPQKFGVRIEDMVVVRDGGCENLTKSSKDLVVL